jgi:hypothetical protein
VAEDDGRAQELEGPRVNLLAAMSRFVERARADWDGVRLADLVFGEKDLALLALFALVGVGIVAPSRAAW